MPLSERQSDIVLVTQNARYHHTGFGLRYLLANLGELKSRAEIIEFGLDDQSHEMAAEILSRRPRIIGLGVYIWNAEQIARLGLFLKRLDPSVFLVLGGPEVSYEQEGPLCSVADWVICGEGEEAFRDLCGAILSGSPPARGVIAPRTVPLETLSLPYGLYTEKDIAERTVYVEGSRGCPFGCEFCLSSLDRQVRYFPLTDFLTGLGTLVSRGARHLKFVDRSFNCGPERAARIMEFLLAAHTPGMLFHFEMVPDFLPDSLLALLGKFPPGALQLEVGVQTFNAEVAARIGRRCDQAAMEHNLRWLRNNTSAHIHADLIAGLPGEGLESFGNGFNRLLKLRPQEVQIGILKRLRGSSIGRHDEQWGMCYAPTPPYEVIRTKDMSFKELLRLRRMSRYFDLIFNSSRFPHLVQLLLSSSPSPFHSFLRLSDGLYSRLGRTHSIAAADLGDSLTALLSEIDGISACEALQAQKSDRELERQARVRSRSRERQDRHLLLKKIRRVSPEGV